MFVDRNNSNVPTDNPAGKIRECRRLADSCPTGKRHRQRGNHAVSGAGNIGHVPCFGGSMADCTIGFEKRHALFAEGQQHILRLESLEK